MFRLPGCAWVPITQASLLNHLHCFSSSTCRWPILWVILQKTLTVNDRVWVKVLFYSRRKSLCSHVAYLLQFRNQSVLLALLCPCFLNVKPDALWGMRFFFQLCSSVIVLILGKGVLFLFPNHGQSVLNLMTYQVQPLPVDVSLCLLYCLFIWEAERDPEARERGRENPCRWITP